MLIRSGVSRAAGSTCRKLVVNFAAQSDGVTADKIIDRLIASTPTKEDELTSDARFKKIFAS